MMQIKVGSAVIPFISHNRDIDYTLISNNKITEEEKNKYYQIYYIKPFQLGTKPNELWFWWSLHWSQIIENWDNETWDYDILLHRKDEVLSFIRSQRDLLVYIYNHSIELNKMTIKWGYHVLGTIYCLQHNSYELTEEEQKNIELMHDAWKNPILFQEWLRLFKWCIDQIDNL